MNLTAEKISRRYMRKTGEANYFDAVKTTDLLLEGGKVTVLTGRSGSGKTTVLHMLSGLLRPTEGRVLLEGKDIYALEDTALSRLRNERFGVVPQGRSAVDTLTVRENILLPATLYCPEKDRKDTEGRAKELMEELGIASLADAWPAELSGGELRRMAIARALCAKPDFIMTDEPTGDLDDENTVLVLELLHRSAREGAAVFLVTHENEALAYADEKWRMDSGLMIRME